MVRGLWLILLACLVVRPVLAGDYRLWVEPSGGDGGDTPVAQLGAPLTLWLHYLGPADLDNLDTTPWQADFEIARGYAQRDDDVQRLRLRLTPRRTGQLTLPPLRLGGALSQPVPIRADPAQVSGERLQPQWSVTPDQVWQGQELRAELTLTMTPGRARLSSTSPHAPGFAILALPPRQQPLADGRMRHRLTWLLRPRQAGVQRIEAPMLRYVVDGVPQRRFHFPDTVLPVRPLPEYVTPRVPVGLLRPGDEDNTVQAIGVTAAQLTAALANAGLAADVTDRLDADSGTLSQARITGNRGAESTARVIYFDPGTGRLQTLPLRQGHGNAVEALLVASLLCIVALLIWQRRRLRGVWRYRRYRRQLQYRLDGARHPRAVAAALLGLPVPGQRRPSVSLLGWLDAYAAADPARWQSLQPLVGRLSAACYARQAWSDQDTRQLRDAI